MMCRKIFGRFGVLSSGFFPSFIANLIAILVERPTRRPALAIYVTNVVCSKHFILTENLCASNLYGFL
jgi:hypothetical protein